MRGGREAPQSPGLAGAAASPAPLLQNGNGHARVWAGRASGALLRSEQAFPTPHPEEVRRRRAGVRETGCRGDGGLSSSGGERGDNGTERERGSRVRGSWSRMTRGGADPWGDREGPRHPGAFRGPPLPVQISTVFRRIKKRQAFKKSINLTTCCPNAFRRLNFGEPACLGRAHVGLESHQLL